VARPGAQGETTFGMAGLIGKKLIALDETAEAMSMVQQNMQKWISGEEVQVSRKYKDAVKTTLAPFLMAGNTMMHYKNTYDNWKRRLGIFDFAYPILKPDPTLPKRLEQAVGRIIWNANCAFKFVTRQTNGSFPDWWVDYFEEMYTRHASESMDEIASLLKNDGEFIMADSDRVLDVYIPLSVLCKTFKKNQHRQLELYLQPFMRSKESLPYPGIEGGRTLIQTFIFGLDAVGASHQNFRLLEGDRNALEAKAPYVFRMREAVRSKLTFADASDLECDPPWTWSGVCAHPSSGF
jgi:hypothetical protein